MGRWGRGERRMDGRRGEDAEKVTPTLTRTFITRFTFSVNRHTIHRESIHRMEDRWRRRYEAGDRETRCKQRIR